MIYVKKKNPHDILSIFNTSGYKLDTELYKVNKILLSCYLDFSAGV